MAEPGVIEEMVDTVKQAAAGQKVIVIRIEVGKSFSVPKVEIAKGLHAAFPGASIDIQDSEDDAVTVKDIEVE